MGKYHTDVLLDTETSPTAMLTGHTIPIISAIQVMNAAF